MRASDERWELRLYLVGMTPRASAALANLKVICESRLEGRYTIDVVDLLEEPMLAVEDQIVATPTVVRRRPSPTRKVVGDLSDHERVVAALEIQRVSDSEKKDG